MRVQHVNIETMGKNLIFRQRNFQSVPSVVTLIDFTVQYQHVCCKFYSIIVIKSFYSLSSIGRPRRASRHCCLQLSPWPCPMIFLCLLSHSLLPFATFSSACLSFCIPEDSNLMQFSILLLFLYVTCVQSSSIFLFVSDFLLTSDGWFSIVLRS